MCGEFKLSINRYVRNKSAKALKDCTESIENLEQQIQRFVMAIEEVREAIAKLDKEINESGASVSNLRENIRMRKLVRDIVITQEEIDSYDMEEAAKAKRKFEEQYNVKKALESELQSKVGTVNLALPALSLQDIASVRSHRRRAKLRSIANENLGGRSERVQRHQY